jgi:hypothetical protein
MGTMPSGSPPPATGNCLTFLKIEGQEPPQPVPMKMARAKDGKMRIDQGDKSIITDPAKRKTIILDHVKKEAMELPMPDGPPAVSLPGMPAAGGPAAPGEPPKVEDLGKALIEGHEVDGKRYTFKVPDTPDPPEIPKPPEMPKPPAGAVPAKPEIPKPPALPEKPELPPKPPIPVETEIWTSTKLLLPVLTRTKGKFGEQICHCKYTEGVEPPPAEFEIPPDYKKVDPPKPPEMPKPEALKPPEMPKPPEAPKPPSAPKIPGR